MWDCRQSLIKGPTSTLNPSQHAATRRKEKYLSAISIRDDWLTVGGGVKTALWHIGAGEPAHVLDMGDSEPLVMLQAETRILIGADDGAIHQFKNKMEAIALSICPRITVMVFMWFVKHQVPIMQFVILLNVFQCAREEEHGRGGGERHCGNIV